MVTIFIFDSVTQQPSHTYDVFILWVYAYFNFELLNFKLNFHSNFQHLFMQDPNEEHIKVKLNILITIIIITSSGL